MPNPHMNVRLPPEVHETFVRFCQATHRHEQETIRAVFKLFLADGPEAAERRLTAGLWQPEDAAALADWITAPARRAAAQEPQRRKGKAG